MSLLRTLALTLCTTLAAQAQVLQINLDLKAPFTFLAYGDTRFTDPADHEAANPQARQLLVKAMAEARPAFISIGGDIVYDGFRAADWTVYDQETAAWKAAGIPVFPILGNHDLHGKEATALDNYFQRYPQLNRSRFYSVRAGNALLLNLDSALDELAGPQGTWLKGQLDALPPGVEFVFLVMHHPPYTSSSDAKQFGGGHSSRTSEQKLAAALEARQAHCPARLVVIAGHVHNYERHEHAGVTYFVSGGGGAHAYPVSRGAADPYQDQRVNYHYLQVAVAPGTATIGMHRLGLEGPAPAWTIADSVTLKVP